MLTAGLDCGKYRRDCLRSKAFDIPAVRLFHEGTAANYDGGFSFESIVNWASNISHIRPIQVTQLVTSPNGRTFRDLIENNACVLSFFHTPWCGPCRRFMPRLFRIARLFKDEPSVKFAEVDADKYRSFIRDYDLKIYPEIRLFVRGEKKPIEFVEKRSPAQVTEFINKHCGTRKDAALLEADVGLIDEANAVLEDFFAKGKKPFYLQKLKAVPRASYYVTLLDGYIGHGAGFISDQRGKCDAAISGETTTQKEKDLLTKKINILNFFQELIEYYD
jgi:thiol-disulfide isomerase/thioredoxin